MAKINPYAAKVQKHKTPCEDTPAAHPRAHVPPKCLGASSAGQRGKIHNTNGCWETRLGIWDGHWMLYNVGVLRFQIIANDWPSSIDRHHWQLEHKKTPRSCHWMFVWNTSGDKIVRQFWTKTKTFLQLCFKLAINNKFSKRKHGGEWCMNNFGLIMWEKSLKSWKQTFFCLYTVHIYT